MTDPVDTAAIREEHASMCGSCDAALPMPCRCSIVDPRRVISRLCDEIDRLRAQVDGLRAEKRNTVKINMDPPSPRMVPVPIRCRRCGYGGA